MFKRLVPLTMCSAIFMACAFPERTGYDRDLGGWKPSPSRHLKTLASGQSNSRLTEIIKPWLGTPYKYGKHDRSGTDCSGFVQAIMDSLGGIKLPHNSAQAYEKGVEIDKENLIAGDVVFFGSLWGIDHSGLWLGDGKFVHASTSKGVTITHLDSDPYWTRRYQGARRFAMGSQEIPE